MVRRRKLLRPYKDFRGGLNLDTSLDNLQDNELLKVENADLDERGGVATRRGTAPLNETAYDAQVEQLNEWPKKDGTKVLWGVLNDGTTKRLVEFNDDGTIKKDIQNPINSERVGYFYLTDYIYFSDGSQFYRYNGTTCEKVPQGSGSDLAPIRKCKYFVWHPKSFRVFAGGNPDDPSALYYSKPNDPTVFESSFKVYPTTGDGPIKGITVFGDSTVVHYENTKWSWKGKDPAEDAEWSKIPVGQGTVNGDTVAQTPASLTFLGLGGVFSMSPGLLDYNMVVLAGEQLIENISRFKVTSVVRGINNKDKTVAIYDRVNEKYMLAFSETGDRNDMILVLDWNLKSFMLYTGIKANDFCQRSNGDLLVASKDYILKMGQGYKDWDVDAKEYVPIHFKVWFKQVDLGYPFHIKKIYRVFLATKQPEELDEECQVDVWVTQGYNTKYFEGVDLDQGFTWGEEWGDPWGYSDLVTSEIRCKLKGHRFQVKVENNRIDQKVILYGFAFEYRIKRPKGVRYTDG